MRISFAMSAVIKFVKHAGAVRTLAVSAVAARRLKETTSEESPMTNNQTERHALGRLGEAIVNKLFGGRTTRHTAPFDVVDFQAGIAYEVKSMSGLSVDKKIHIQKSSMKRKRAFAREYGLKAVLIAIVIHDENNIEVYKSPLKESVRVTGMRRVK